MPSVTHATLQLPLPPQPRHLRHRLLVSHDLLEGVVQLVPQRLVLVLLLGPQALVVLALRDQLLHDLLLRLPRFPLALLVIAPALPVPTTVVPELELGHHALELLVRLVRPFLHKTKAVVPGGPTVSIRVQLAPQLAVVEVIQIPTSMSEPAAGPSAIFIVFAIAERIPVPLRLPHPLPLKTKDGPVLLVQGLVVLPETPIHEGVGGVPPIVLDQQTLLPPLHPLVTLGDDVHARRSLSSRAATRLPLGFAEHVEPRGRGLVLKRARLGVFPGRTRTAIAVEPAQPLCLSLPLLRHRDGPPNSPLPTRGLQGGSPSPAPLDVL